MRIALLGNAGSGKSTLARWLAARTDSAVLDLDGVAWEPGREAIPRDPQAAREDVLAFCRAHDRWIVEGCYASLVAVSLSFRPLLILLDPGEAQCVENCSSRPWEPHKYGSREEQDERLDALIDWVRGYATRSGELSAAGHREVFDAYAGSKLLLQRQVDLTRPPTQLVARLR